LNQTIICLKIPLELSLSLLVMEVLEKHAFL